MNKSACAIVYDVLKFFYDNILNPDPTNLFASLQIRICNTAVISTFSIPWRQIFFTSIRVWRRCGTCWTTRMTTWKPPPSRPSASSSSPTSRVEWVGGSIPMSSVSDPHSFFANADTDPAAFLMRIWIQLTNLERTKIYLVWRVFWRSKRQKKNIAQR